MAFGFLRQTGRDKGGWRLPKWSCAGGLKLFKTVTCFKSHFATVAKLKYRLCHLHGKWYEPLRFFVFYCEPNDWSLQSLALELPLDDAAVAASPAVKRAVRCAAASDSRYGWIFRAWARSIVHMDSV